MCDSIKYTKIFEELKQLAPEDTIQLIMDSKDDEEKEFFRVVGNYLLQLKQRQAIERNLF